MRERRAAGSEDGRAVGATDAGTDPCRSTEVDVDVDPRSGLPVDVAAWIDAHDPPAVSPDATPGPPRNGTGSGSDPEVDRAEQVLARQRSEHQPPGRSGAGVLEANDVLGALVDNTGDDGGAASG